MTARGDCLIVRDGIVKRSGKRQMPIIRMDVARSPRKVNPSIGVLP